MTIGIKFVIPLLFENPSFSSSVMKLKSGNMTPVNLDLSATHIPVESNVTETHAVKMFKDVIKEIVREVTLQLRTRVEVIKELQLTKTVVQDMLVVTKDRVEVSQPVTVLEEIPLYNERIIEVPVREERIQEKLVELTRQVPVGLVRQVSINVPKVVHVTEQVQMEHQVVHEVHVTTSTGRIRNMEVIKEIPVEMIRKVPLTTHKATVHEVPQKETIQIEKLVELQTAHEVIKTVDVAKDGIMSSQLNF